MAILGGGSSIKREIGRCSQEIFVPAEFPLTHLNLHKLAGELIASVAKKQVRIYSSLFSEWDMSATASRWWVRLAARWLARVDGVSGMIRLAMLGMTGLSTATLTLRQYGHGEYAWPLIAVVLVGTLIFTYLYTEGGVWNQMSRDRQDLSNNFAGPSMRIENELLARGLLAAQEQRELSDPEREAIKTELDAAFDEYRDGLTLQESEEQESR